MSNILTACLAFIFSLFIVILITAMYVDPTPQGPILFFSAFTGLVVTMCAWHRYE